jgi:G-patch domain
MHHLLYAHISLGELATCCWSLQKISLSILEDVFAEKCQYWPIISSQIINFHKWDYFEYSLHLLRAILLLETFAKCCHCYVNLCVYSSDARPGLVPERVARQYQKEIKHKTLNFVNRSQNKPRHLLETEQREEGLKNALTSDNRGFKLLEKMGYKPGTAIGKTGMD